MGKTVLLQKMCAMAEERSEHACREMAGLGRF